MDRTFTISAPGVTVTVTVTAAVGDAFALEQPSLWLLRDVKNALDQLEAVAHESLPPLQPTPQPAPQPAPVAAPSRPPFTEAFARAAAADAL